MTGSRNPHSAQSTARLLLRKLILNSDHERSDSGVALEFSPGSSKELNHRKAVETDIDLFRGKLLCAALQLDRATKRIRRFRMQLKIRCDFNFRFLQRRRNFIEKSTQQEIRSVFEVCHEN